MGADCSALRDMIGDLVLEGGSEAALDLFRDLEVPVASGLTRDSGQVTYAGGGPAFGQWIIEFPTPQAAFTDEGTDPHVIEGNPWLVFTGRDGTKVFVRSPAVVNHPGTPATGWFSGDEGVTDERWAMFLEDELGRLA